MGVFVEDLGLPPEAGAADERARRQLTQAACNG